MDEIRIYVASLSDYNAGVLHGVWIDLGGKPDVEDVYQAVQEMLKASPTAASEGLPAEEWAIHDYEGFEGVRLSEWDSFGRVVDLAEGIGEHGAAFAAWEEHRNAMGLSYDEDFDDYFCGEWDSCEDFAEEWFYDVYSEQLGELDESNLPVRFDRDEAWMQLGDHYSGYRRDGVWFVFGDNV